jgi:endogenous inhibitor of DNA gyrase (YacG/DUF329 family)
MENTECPQCGGPVEQSGRGRPRRFCKPQCGVDFYNDAKPRKYTDQDGYDATRHMLTEIDPDAMIATCSQCGPQTRVWSAGPRRVQCSNAMRARQQKPENVRSNRHSGWRGQGIDMTVERFDELLVAQLGRCAACDAPLEAGRGAIHVDHCHDSSVVRGLLCRRCNRGLGIFGDDPELLVRLADYLERNATTAARP